MFEIKKPCLNCKSYVLKPKKKVKLNLESIVKNIKELSFEVLAFTGSMLSLRKKCKINIYSSGKTIIKTKDSKLVEKLSKELSNILYPKELDA